MGSIFKCPECDNYDSNKIYNVIRHLRTVHEATPEDVKRFRAIIASNKSGGAGAWECQACLKQTPSKRALEAHISKYHPPKPVDPSDISLHHSPPPQSPPPKKVQLAPVSTVLVQKVSSAPQKPREVSGDIECPVDECDATFNKRYDLGRHFSESHSDGTELESVTFSTKAEFVNWLNNLNQDTCTSWKVRDSRQIGPTRCSYFVCRHEGAYQSKANVHLVSGSKKQTGSKLCPAFLQTKESENGSISVTGLFSHYGHDLLHALRKLSPQETEYIIGLMKDGFSNSQIIKKGDRYSSSSRLFYLVPDDLRYIRKANHLHEGRFHDDDFESVKSRVERGCREDGILHYTPSGDRGAGFRIVIMSPGQLEICEKYGHRGVSIDDTHNCTQYSLKLTTMLVINGQDRGIPIAFMLSSSVTSEDVGFFFQSVREVLPSFHPEFLISDEAPAFWNGYSQTFPDRQTKRLWCRWHVLRALGKNADELLTKETSTQVKKDLGNLIREPDRILFDKKISTLLEFLESMGPSGKRYAEYLRTYYLGKSEFWATCFRRGTPFHTSMMNESWHSTLKKKILGGKTNIRVDELIQVLYDAFEFVVQSISKQVGRNLKKASSRKAKNLKNCQVASAQIHNYVVSRNENGDVEVEKKSSGVIYVLKDSVGCMCLEDENVHCECGACAYRFSCSCQAQLSGVACKHTHIALLYYNSYQHDGPTIDEFQPFENLPSPPPRQNFSIPLPPRPTIESATGKTYDDFILELDTLASKMRSMKKDPRNSEEMERILKIIREANDSLPGSSSSSTVPVRNDASRRPMTCRQTMNHFPKRQKRKSQRAAAKSLPLARDPAICNVCKRTDPVLHDDVDFEEFDAQITEWRRCAACKQPVHYLCSNATCPSCDGSFERYEPSVEEQIDSSETSDSDADEMEC